MPEQAPLSRGDVVIHPRRPEWGEGLVEQATAITHDGKPAQRLVIQFPNQGMVIINTGVAPLVRKDATNAMSTSTTPGSSPLRATKNGSGWLDSLAPRSEAGELAKLPEAMTDPFASIERRLQATLDAYRFSTEPRSLIEWGVAQTGLSDPLSKYTRHDLEGAFPRFARDRDNNLQELVRLLKRQNKASLLEQTVQATRLPAARTALQRAIRN